jgi:hypothetical protein
MSLIVIATKLSQPFDDIFRYPKSDADPSSVQIDWKKWVQIMAEPPSHGLRRGEAIHITDADVLGMSKKAMDDYLDWHQRNWIDDRNAKSMRLTLRWKDGFNLLQFLSKCLISFLSSQSLNPRSKSQMMRDMQTA